MRTSVTKIRLAGVGLLVVVLLAIYLAFTAIGGVPGYPYKTVKATFASASNVVAHDDVRINGARIGQVTGTHFNRADNTTTVTLQLQQGHTVYANGSASVGDVSALGAEYIELQPGDKTSGPLPAGGIPLAHTTTPVEIDSILSIFGPQQANAAAAAVQTLGQGFTGQQQNIHTLLVNAPKLLPNLGTTARTLTDPQAALVPLIAQANALTSAFQGRQQQLAQLLANMNTTFAALDTANGQPLQDTINAAAPVLPELTPALNQLSGAAGVTTQAVDDLKPGLAALGAATPDLRAALREGVAPLNRVPSVAKQAVPGVRNLTTTLATLQTTQPVVPFASRLVNQALPLVSYLVPYTGDMTALWDSLANALRLGDNYGNWLPFTITADTRTLLGSAAPDGSNLNNSSLATIGEGRCGYPKPGLSASLSTTNKGAC